MNRNQRRAVRSQTVEKAGSQFAELAARATEHGRAGRLDQAIALMKEAIAANAHLGVLHGNLGTMYYAAGRLIEAELCFRQAIALDSSLVKSHFNLGAVLETRG